MIRRTAVGAAALLLLALTGCTAESPAPTPSASTGGSLELAVSTVCAPGVDPQCVAVGGQNVVVDPAAFTRAGIASAGVVDTGGVEVVDVRFDDEGAAVFQRSTREAADAGAEARLLMRAGDELVAATTVMQAMEGDSVQIAPGDADAQEIVDLIRAG
ncbi:SecDF P1 head subdomain-containing protein [Rathayibacter tanaceti]|uniref:SecDF P1 head subdomain domain-containing protein n=2 Tax=Rathayibacter tanaceti TaxID=1671680 RepID=A0A166HSQ2_9MICO|nr:hypothetical protein [Rathayibacter tanaceti]KZX21106.1 hypothetical protein ACH61_01762 [Rathayibacter tanaceti]QHC56676.1 hypothetical protein GSU10_14275 [Rathayibacter tanaceti]TCO36172.1 hypothetical protein EV639_10837 [Rathayibacter tanaceti]